MHKIMFYKLQTLVILDETAYYFMHSIEKSLDVVVVNFIYIIVWSVQARKVWNWGRLIACWGNCYIIIICTTRNWFDIRKWLRRRSLKARVSGFQCLLSGKKVFRLGFLFLPKLNLGIGVVCENLRIKILVGQILGKFGKFYKNNFFVTTGISKFSMLKYRYRGGYC